MRKGQKKAAATANSSRPEQNASLAKKQDDFTIPSPEIQARQLGQILRAINFERLLWSPLEKIYWHQSLDFSYSQYLWLVGVLSGRGYIECKDGKVRITGKGIRALATEVEGIEI